MLCYAPQASCRTQFWLQSHAMRLWTAILLHLRQCTHRNIITFMCNSHRRGVLNFACDSSHVIVRVWHAWVLYECNLYQFFSWRVFGKTGTQDGYFDDRSRQCGPCSHFWLGCNCIYFVDSDVMLRLQWPYVFITQLLKLCSRFLPGLMGDNSPIGNSPKYLRLQIAVLSIMWVTAICIYVHLYRGSIHDSSA